MIDAHFVKEKSSRCNTKTSASCAIKSELHNKGGHFKIVWGVAKHEPYFSFPGGCVIIQITSDQPQVPSRKGSQRRCYMQNSKNKTYTTCETKHFEICLDVCGGNLLCDPRVVMSVFMNRK